jgi:hypothetical protein
MNKITKDQIISILLVGIAFLIGITTGIAMLPHQHNMYPVFVDSTKDCSDFNDLEEFLVVPNNLFKNNPFPIKACNLKKYNSYVLNITDSDRIKTLLEINWINLTKNGSSVVRYTFADFDVSDGLIIIGLYNKTTILDVHISVIIDLRN